MGWWTYQPYVSAAERRAKAAREQSMLAKRGAKFAPVKIAGRTIASSFWGKAWCENLESYSDFENRLPRGRSYVRNGSVLNLEIEEGKINALVCGSAMYQITISITPLAAARWGSVKTECSGQIGSLIELLQARLSNDVMQIVTHREKGLFPSPKEIKMTCSCPDWAGMCKHVAAVLYGVGNRLDSQPDLLFKLRQVDHLELISSLPDSVASTSSASKKKTIAEKDLAQVFGIELAEEAPAIKPRRPTPAARPRKTIKPKTKTRKRAGK